MTGTQNREIWWPRVVVGVDGSPNSLQALRRAAGQAYRRGGGLEVVYVIPPDSGPAEATAGDVVPHCLDHADCQVDICADQRVQDRDYDRSATVGSGHG